MIPFRAFERDAKQMWIILNYHPTSGTYLCAREDDNEKDGELRIIPEKEVAKFRLVDFLDEDIDE